MRWRGDSLTLHAPHRAEHPGVRIGEPDAHGQIAEILGESLEHRDPGAVSCQPRSSPPASAGSQTVTGFSSNTLATICSLQAFVGSSVASIGPPLQGSQFGPRGRTTRSA